MLAHQRRQLLHARIPDVYTARETFGPRFEELYALLAGHDPAGLGERASSSPLYPEVARTILYQLPKAKSSQQLAELLQQELTLWFGRLNWSASQQQSLVAAVDAWHLGAKQ